jgi:hypothetical protein
VSSAVLSWAIQKFVVGAKKRRDFLKFSDPNYSIGAAVINMERAITYGDGENFKFFARYAIRTRLGMARAYPPNEPSTDEIRTVLEKGSISIPVTQKILKIYATAALPDNSNEWKAVLEDVRSIIAATENSP